MFTGVFLFLLKTWKSKMRKVWHSDLRAVPVAAAGSVGRHGPRGWWRVSGPNGRPREAQTHSAAAGPVAPRTQVPAAGAGQWGGEGLHTAPLPHHEERPQPHDTLPGWQVLPGWVKVLYFQSTRLAWIQILNFWLTPFFRTCTCDHKVVNRYIHALTENCHLSELLCDCDVTG